MADQWLATDSADDRFSLVTVQIEFIGRASIPETPTTANTTTARIMEYSTKSCACSAAQNCLRDR